MTELRGIVFRGSGKFRFLGQCCGFARGCRKNVKAVGGCGKVVQNLCQKISKFFPVIF